MQITYQQIREAMERDEELPDNIYFMKLAGDERKAVTQAVNQGIDAHLEACFCPAFGDSYEYDGHFLECRVSPKSLPTLLRRLTEMPGEEDCEAETLASDILTTLGFDVETCCFEIVSPVDEETPAN